MKTSIEQLLADIYALDASLKERDHEVRMLVEELVKLRPQIALDPTFVRSLRARLVEAPAPHMQRASEHALSWWMVRLVPLGAIALLIVMLVPQTQTPSRMDLGGGGGGSTSYRTPSSMGGGGTAPAMMAPQDAYKEDSVQSYADPASDTAAQRAVGTEMLMIMENSVYVSTQAPGKEVYIDSVTLMQAGYVAVFADENGSPRELIGVSNVIASGSSGGIMVPLVRAMESGQSFHAMLIADNGDGVFDTRYDSPVLDQNTLEPMSVRFAAQEGVTGPEQVDPPSVIEPDYGGGTSPSYGGMPAPEPEPHIEPERDPKPMEIE